MAYIPRLVKKKLGEILQDGGFLKEEQIQNALVTQQKEGKPLGEILVNLGYVKEQDIAYALARQYGLPYIDASRYVIQGDCRNLLPSKLMLDHRFVVLDKIGKFLIIAIAGAIDPEMLEQVEQKSSSQICLYVSTSSQVLAALKKYYSVE